MILSFLNQPKIKLHCHLLILKSFPTLFNNLHILLYQLYFHVRFAISYGPFPLKIGISTFLCLSSDVSFFIQLGFVKFHHYTNAYFSTGRYHLCTYFRGSRCLSWFYCFCCYRHFLLLLLPDAFRGMGAWRRTMEPQKPGNSAGPGPEVVKTQRIAKEPVPQRVRSWTVQNEMRGVLERVSTGDAGRALNSANPRKIRA